MEATDFLGRSLVEVTAAIEDYLFRASAVSSIQCSQHLLLDRAAIA
jgi:hypothetical protein